MKYILTRAASPLRISRCEAATLLDGRCRRLAVHDGRCWQHIHREQGAPREIES